MKLGHGLVFGCLVLAACESTAASDDTNAPETGASTPPGTSDPKAPAPPDPSDAAAPDGSPAEKPIPNPVERNFADPTAIEVGDDGARTIHVYATKSRGKNIPHAMSTDLRSWPEDDAMPKLASWLDPEGAIWAPGVIAVSKTRYVMFYAAKLAGSAPAGEKGHMCIGRAVAASPAGPFVDAHDAPLVCRNGAWSIDPSPFAAADGSLWLVWRQDVDAAGAPTKMNTVAVQALSKDGDDFAAGSSSTELLRRDDATWESPIVENPTMVHAEGKYWLFYSANEWRTADYGIGYATCTTPKGPCTKKSTKAAWLSSVPAVKLAGAGGEDVVRGVGGAPAMRDGALVMVHHGWIAPKVGPDAAGSMRALWLEHLALGGSAPAATLVH